MTKEVASPELTIDGAPLVDVGIRLFFVGLAFGLGVVWLVYGWISQEDDAVSMVLKAAFSIAMILVANSLIQKLKKFGIRA
jgi:hypothetical protein